jgi:hypothetical protein
MTVLGTISHVIFSKSLENFATRRILTLLCVRQTERERKTILFMSSIKSPNCLSILMNIKISFWKLDLPISIKLTGHPKDMILLYSLSSRPIFSFAKF